MQTISNDINYNSNVIYVNELNLLNHHNLQCMINEIQTCIKTANVDIELSFCTDNILSIQNIDLISDIKTLSILKNSQKRVHITVGKLFPTLRYLLKYKRMDLVEERKFEILNYICKVLINELNSNDHKVNLRNIIILLNNLMDYTDNIEIHEMIKTVLYSKIDITLLNLLIDLLDEYNEWCSNSAIIQITNKLKAIR